jgi:hypothetical protein
VAKLNRFDFPLFQKSTVFFLSSIGIIVFGLIKGLEGILSLWDVSPVVSESSSLSLLSSYVIVSLSGSFSSISRLCSASI